MKGKYRGSLPGEAMISPSNDTCFLVQLGLLHNLDVNGRHVLFFALQFARGEGTSGFPARLDSATGRMPLLVPN
jgi:hypothetical protein